MRLRTNADSETSPPASPSRWTGRRLLRWAVNAWLIFHLTAIVIAPASVSPSSALVQSAWRVFQPYLQILYLNHGYHFFAPEPSESTLLAFVAEREDGTFIRGRIPDRAIQPRLLYHRHFMLTEQMGGAPPELGERWLRSYAEHLGHQYGASRVSLTRQIHYLPTMEMVRAGVRLNDPASYEEQPLGVFQCGEL
jgi:hypothetical protein